MSPPRVPLFMCVGKPIPVPKLSPSDPGFKDAVSSPRLYDAACDAAASDGPHARAKRGSGSGQWALGSLPAAVISAWQLPTIASRVGGSGGRLTEVMLRGCWLPGQRQGGARLLGSSYKLINVRTSTVCTPLLKYQFSSPWHETRNSIFGAQSASCSHPLHDSTLQSATMSPAHPRTHRLSRQPTRTSTTQSTN
jgi:hypothetical protein